MYTPCLEPQFLQNYSGRQRKIGYNHMYMPLPRAPAFAGVLGQVKKNMIESYVYTPCLEPQLLRGYSGR